MSAFYNPFVDPQTQAPAFYCDRCNGEIYRGDTCYMQGHLILCEFCGADKGNHPETGNSIDNYFKTLYGG